MRTIETTVYKFEELSQEAQQAAIENLWDLNVDHDWWENVYEDAENIGLKITSFSDYKVEGKFTGSAMETAEKILAEHGEHCETWKSAQVYMNDYKELIAAQCQTEADFLCQLDGFDADAIFEETPEIDTEDIDDDLLKSLREDYRITLQKEYDYLTSEEAIKESIISNEYEFTAEGEMI